MPLRLVVDTSIIFAAILRDSTTRRILLSAPIEFYTPEYCFDEIREPGTVPGMTSMARIMAAADQVTFGIRPREHRYYPARTNYNFSDKNRNPFP